MRMFVHRSRPPLAGLAIACLPIVGCVDSPAGTQQAGTQQAGTQVAATQQAVGAPARTQVPLNPTTIPQFVNELPIPRVYAPTVVNDQGKPRHEYTVSVQQTLAQLLPPGFPATNVMAYGGNVKIAGSNTTEFVRTSPGPVFDNTRGIPSIIHWRNEVTGPHFLPIDPTVKWANPAGLEPPVGPFTAFPISNLAATSPVAIVTHNHGLVVAPQHDGIADEWFTASFHRGPNFTTQDYFEPNEQPSTQLFYHDHTMGITRLNVYGGLAGTAYFIRDPNNPLDQDGSPLPRGEFEIPLMVADKAFFTDGELNFPRVSVNKKNAYWSPGGDGDTILVNGKVWPNLNVQRRQYRFRTLAAGNGRQFNITLDNTGTLVPFTLIGSDGGYLPVPKIVTTVTLATTERADMLVDFSQFAPGTKIIMRNAGAAPAATVGVIMQFTVQGGDAVAPPALPALVARAELPTDAPKRIKTFHMHLDADGDQLRSIDGLDFTAPPTEFPLIGSTDQWDFVNLGGGPHFVHIHLIEFQVLERQAINVAAYLQRWHVLNGHVPVTRPIVVDPTPFLIGAPIPPQPDETGWKDTARVAPGQVLRLVTRWAPQETPSGGVAPGENQFPIEPASPDTNAWYLWHCHILGHEDNDMMRKMPVVNAWTPDRRYATGTVIAYQNVDYRARVAHTASASEPPDQRFDVWERVNNNDGTWQPQIIYAVGDRVLHAGKLYRANTVHQAQVGQGPDLDPARWEPFPMAACAQLTKLCADKTRPAALTCQNTGAANVEATCLTQLDGCLAQCETNVQSPCSGLCNNPTRFTRPDGATFDSGPLGTGPGCFETTSAIQTGRCANLAPGQELTINGKAMRCDGKNWDYPLTSQRNFGYCIQTTAGQGASGSFQAW